MLITDKVYYQKVPTLLVCKLKNLVMKNKKQQKQVLSCPFKIRKELMIFVILNFNKTKKNPCIGL